MSKVRFGNVLGLVWLATAVAMLLFGSVDLSGEHTVIFLGVMAALLID